MLFTNQSVAVECVFADITSDTRYVNVLQQFFLNIKSATFFQKVAGVVDIDSVSTFSKETHVRDK